MKLSLSSRSLIGLLAIGLWLPAATISEVGDAGQTPGTAQSLGSGIDVVQGSISGDIDLYRIFFNFTGSLGVGVVSTGGDWDPNLLIFNDAGNPLYGDDDGGGGLDSFASISITPGYYLIAVGDNNTDAYDGSSVYILGNDDGDSPAELSGVLATFEGGSSTGSYNLTFSQQSSEGTSGVPEPSTYALVAGALAVVGWRRRMVAR